VKAKDNSKKSITKNKPLKNETKRSENDHYQAFDNASDGIVFLEPNKHGQFKIIEADLAFELAIGLTREQIIGKNFEQITTDEIAPDIIEKLRYCMKTASPIKEEMMINFPTGMRLFQLTFIPMRNENEQINRILGIVHDIGMRKQTENIMQARLRLLEFANSHSMDEFLTATLDEIEALTESTIGFYHFLEADQTTLSLQNWSTNTLNTMCNADGKGSHYDVSQAGVWVDCVKERCPVIHNDYYSLEYRRGMPDGHAPVIREAVVPIFRGGQIKAIIGVGNKPTDYGEFDIMAVSQLGDLSWDIVERKLAEAALRVSEAKHRLIVETATEGILVLGPDTLTTFANVRMAEMLGYTCEEIIGRCLTDFMFEDDMPDHFKKIEDRRRGVSEHYQRRFRRKDGQTLWTLASATPIFDNENRYQGAFAMFTDITERKHIESELQKALENLERTLRFNEAVLSSIPNPVFFKDKEGRYLGCNLAFTEFMGVTPEQIKGKTVGELWPSEHANVYHEKDLELMRNPGRQLYEFKVKDKDGQERPVIYSKDVFRDENDQVAGIIVAFADITQVKKAEEALRESEAKHRQHLESLVEERTLELSHARDAAESSNRAKSIFLANMSHELRTPLNAILGFTQLMGRDESIPGHAKRNLAIINRSGEHLLSMINDVLDLSKIEAGKVELKEEPFDLVQTMQDIGEMIRARAREKRLEVIVDLAPNIQQYVKADLGKIRQILINLLGNSVKFTEDGGIALRVRTVQTPGNSDRALLELEVEDTGPGIPNDRLEAIFTPFTQAGSTKSSLMGTGLGLTISQSYARMMGGNISVESKEGKGSIFKLQLGVEIASEDMMSPTEVRQSIVVGVEDGEPDYRILIVEDNDENAILLKTLLDQAGLNTRVARDGKEGVEMAEAWRPHFIWMDIKMPVMDGYDATRFIRSKPWGKEIVIVAFTASAFSDQESNILDVGCNCIVRKPFRSQEIFDAMSKHLGIRFIYSKTLGEEYTDTCRSDKIENPSISELESLPAKVVESILKATVELDKHSILAIAHEFAQSHPNLSVYLENQVLSYNFEAIEVLFSSVKMKKAS
jgi:PAS domain S-box-containing protein